MKIETLEASRAERAAWLALCLTLKSMGAVTGADLNSRQSERATPGQRLLAEIRKWGDRRADLGDR